ncbi:MAG TPA: hypothetical protein VFF48_11345 [Brevundimonas sp.]|nr:hypothetical protein [Brevundimonas sp.]
MTAAAAMPPQTGLKRLAAALGVLCTVLSLLALENRFALEAVRALETGVGAVADRAARLAGDMPSRAAEGVTSLTDALPFAPPVAAAPEDVALAGDFFTVDGAGPASVAFVAAEVRLGSGEAFRTEPSRIATGSDRYEAGQTFARRLKARADAQIELRRIVPATPDGEVASTPLCGGGTPGMLALLHRGAQVDVMLFRVGPNPGPDAQPGRLCGVWTFERR